MIAASILALSLVFIGGFSVIGLLQSTERVGSSGVVVRSLPPPLPPPPPSPPSPPPEPTIEIDIFSDSACTQPLSSVVWGDIEAGSSMNKVIYVKNSGDDGVILSLSTDNWVPAGVDGYMQLTWDYDGSTINPGGVFQITLTLSVDLAISGVSSFSFDIVIIGSAS